MRQVGQQVGGIAKAGVGQIIGEPLEVLKTAGQQLAGQPESAVESTTGGQNISPPTKPPSGPSVVEQKKHQLMAAHRRELDELIAGQRQARQQQLRQAESVQAEERKVAKEQQATAQKESIFQRTLKNVTGRLKRRVETRMPKAA